jgi:hypothetical protein
MLSLLALILLFDRLLFVRSPHLQLLSLLPTQHPQEFFFNGETLGNAFVHHLDFGTRNLSPVIGIKGDQTRLSLLPWQTFSHTGLSSQRALYELSTSLDALRRISEGQDLPSSFVSSVFQYWKRWAKGREYRVTLKTGLEIAVDISEEACKGTYFSEFF